MHPELKVFWLKDGRADESSRRRQQEQHLRLICWNVEGKRRLDDSPLPNEWAALLLQESSLYFEAAPHAWNTCLSHNQHTQAAVVVHHRLAPDITAWGGDVFPWIYFSRWALALSSLYLPNIDRTDTEWDDSIIHFHDVIGQMRASTCRVCFGGDLNASSLATLVGASHWGGGGAAGDAGDEFRGTIARSLNRSIDLEDLLAAKQLVLLPPEGGVVPTFVPYNRDQKERNCWTTSGKFSVRNRSAPTSSQEPRTHMTLSVS